MYGKQLRERLEWFLRKSKVEQWAVLFSGYILVFIIHSGAEGYFHLNIVLVVAFIAGVLFLRSLLLTPYFWALAACLMLLKIFEDWQIIPNHVFLMTYLCVLMTLVLSYPKEKQEHFLKLQAAIVFSLVMILAGLQKALSPAYVSGSVLELMFLTGDIAPQILKHNISLARELARNQDALVDFGNNFFENGSQPFVWTSPFFHSISQSLAWIIIVSEFGLGACALWFFEKSVFQILIIAFIWGVFIVTPEGGFLSLLLIIAWTRLPDTAKGIHWAYLFSLLLILTFLIQRISAG